MRDERWVHRFFYAWNDDLFFDPLDVDYEPQPGHFLAHLDAATRALYERSGIWWSHRHNPSLPAQGWKIHVSAGLHNVRDVATASLEYLTTRHVDHKIALDLNIFEMLSSKAMSRGSGGKLITVYPGDDDEFRACAADLADVLGDAAGAYVLSDLRYRDSRSVYFRYGQLLDVHTVDVLGRPVPQVTGPDGPEPDHRPVEFVQPSWVTWPFPDWKPADSAAASDDADVLGGRFRVIEALQFSNSGGVYIAEDTADGDRRVVLKEARPHTNINPRRGHDAIDILAREWAFLERLADVDAFPTPIATFRHWEHDYIAEEYVDRADIRSVLLERNPLVRPGPTVERSREFLRIYLTVFRGLAHAVRSAHRRGVALGDLSAANVLIDPTSFEVTIIDLESCRLTVDDPAGPGLHEPVEIYTPGFSHSRRQFVPPSEESDAFSLATVMAYFVFPIVAMSYLRDDVLGLFRVFTDALGWPAAVHDLVVGLAEARVTLSDVLDVVDDTTVADLIGRVGPPSTVDTANAVDPGRLAGARAGVAAFIGAVADPDRATLFPVDPFAHTTNPLSLGFGASGVLWALDASDVPVRPEWLGWLRDRLDDLDPQRYPDGLMTGLAGIAWAADTLGLGPQARRLLAEANRRGPAVGDYTFYYGLAGLGMTNLRFHLIDGSGHHLEAATECARALRDTVRRDGSHAFWLNDFSDGQPMTGLGFGQAGVALFLLRMHRATGDDEWRRLGRAALDWEMANTVTVDDRFVMFEHRGTIEPYVEVGSAGVAQVLLRYGDLDGARTVLSGLDVGQSVLAGYAFGISGIADALLDATSFTGDPSYRDVAVRQLDFVRRVFLFEPDERFGIRPVDGVTPLGVPGDGLLRCSCDYLTGSAGVLRVLHRATHGGPADFLLDELNTEGGSER